MGFIGRRPGSAEFYGPDGNYIAWADGARGPDLAMNWRCDHTRPPVPAIASRPMDTIGGMQYGAAGLTVFIITTIPTFPGPSVAYAAMAAAGYPAIGERVQLQGDWNPATNICSMLWRRPGADLMQGADGAATNGWQLLGSLDCGAVTLFELAGSFTVASIQASCGMVGRVYRVTRRLAGVLDFDINFDTNIVDPRATVITATAGGPANITRTGPRALTLNPAMSSDSRGVFAA